jgi:Zn-finger nucleic acid-binding protein
MCGAPVASLDSSHCEHCGARLATVACPSCFGMIFEGAKFCSHCGAKVERMAVDEETKAACPHCNLGLETVLVGNTNLRECPECEGIWMDNASFDQICADREQQSAVLGMAFSLPQHQIGAADLNVRYYPCPI